MKKMLVFCAVLAVLFGAMKVAERVDPAGYSRFEYGAGMFAIGAGVFGVPVGVIGWMIGAAHERGRIASQMLQQNAERREQREPEMTLGQQAALMFYLRNGFNQPTPPHYGQPQIPTHVVQRPAQHTVTVIGGD